MVFNILTWIHHESGDEQLLIPSVPALIEQAD
jgi:hypothetical protein